MKEQDTPKEEALPVQRFTSARIALGRTGRSLPVKELLKFNLAHAHARDAVFTELNRDSLEAGLKAAGLPAIPVKSKAADKFVYLQYPYRGRTLSEDSAMKITAAAEGRSFDLSVTIADGLCAEAVNEHALPLLNVLLPMFNAAGLALAPVVLAEYGRVALADEIGSLFRARLSLILIGERPGLSSPCSMGAYLTYAPGPSLTDESRNCVSNIHSEGLNPDTAAEKIRYLALEALRRGISGVGLKEEADLLTQKTPGQGRALL
jgi:ethanolamine ammonia-lyase small subunit